MRTLQIRSVNVVAVGDCMSRCTRWLSMSVSFFLLPPSSFLPENQSSRAFESPFTVATGRSVCTTSIRSTCRPITVSMSLYAAGASST